MTREFGAVVEAQRFWQTALKGNRFQYTDHAAATEAAFDFDRQALSREVVDDHQSPKRATAGERIVHEIQGPPLVWAGDRRDRVSANIAHFALLARPDLQAELAVDASHSMLAGRNSFATQQNQQSTPAPTRALGSEFLQPSFQ
jgi:hypothetical protein